MQRIPVAGPSITQKEIDYVTDAVTSAWYSNANVYNAKFESAFAAYIGVKFAVALPSCTSAIHLSLLALGIGKDNEVIVPDATWIASAAPISYVGATPVFADIDPDTWCLCAQSFEACITPRTKAVIVVDLYGNMPNMAAILDVARRHNILLIEDAAEAVGSEFDGRKAGGFGQTGVFSFHGSKTLTTGEGGMLVTDNEDIYNRVLFLRDHGRQPGDKLFHNTEVAYKYKMSSMQAALGLAQLERIEELIARKLEIFHWYSQELFEVPGVTINQENSPLVKNTYWMVTVSIDSVYGLPKEKLMELMSERGVDCRPFFYQLSSLPAYSESVQSQIAKQRNINSAKICPCAINLPSALILDRSQVKYVCDTLKEILDEADQKRSLTG